MRWSRQEDINFLSMSLDNLTLGAFSLYYLTIGYQASLFNLTFHAMGACIHSPQGPVATHPAVLSSLRSLTDVPV